MTGGGGMIKRLICRAWGHQRGPWLGRVEIEGVGECPVYQCNRCLGRFAV